MGTFIRFKTMFKCLPNPFCSKSVDQVDKRHCNLTQVPDDVLRYTRTLEELFLDANQLRELPRGLYKLAQLRRLTVSDNEIEYLSPDVGCLVNLQEFDFSRNEICEIPEEIKFCKALQILDASGNPLQNGLPKGFTELTNLSQLTLNDVSLTHLPENIGNLINLHTLEVRENLLRTIPESFSKITKLYSLDLGNNEVESLPSSIGLLTNLSELWLDVNELTSLPEEICCLHNLQCLDLSENKIASLPSQIGNLETLTNLELSGNRLKEIPESIGSLKNLSILKVDQNFLTHLPESIGDCVSLSELVLTENSLQELPATIGKLKRLTNLNVDRNCISQLTLSLADCEELGVLSLRDNRLSYVPSELSRLKNLHVLDLTGNRLQNLPCSLLESSLKAIWLSENQAQPMLKFQEEFDEKTHEHILTCFLLPQQQYSTPSMENLLKEQSTKNTSNQMEFQAPEAAQDYASAHERSGSVKFAEGTLGDTDSTLRRHNTPHPKDLRMWKRRLPYSSNRHSVDLDSTLLPAICTKPMALPRREDSCDTNAEDDTTEIAVDHADDTKTIEKKGSPSINNQVYVEKRVEFSDNTYESDEDERPHRLHRKDTPHYLKNKRIQNVVYSRNAPTTNPSLNSLPQSVSKSDFEPIKVILKRKRLNESFGFVITARGTAKKQEVFISHVDEDKCPELRVGDQILKLNGVFVSTLPDNALGKLLSQANGHEIELFILRSHQGSPYSINPNYVPIYKKFGNSPYPILEIAIQKHEGPMGLSIVGGVDQASQPFGVDQRGVFVFKVQPKGAAANAGIRQGDRILMVNGVDVSSSTHKQAVDALLKTNEKAVLLVRRDPLPEGFMEIIVDRRPGEPFGVKINGGLDGNRVNPSDPGDEGIFITEVVPGSAADRDGRLKVGTRILAIDGQSIMGAKLEDAERCMSSSGLKTHLTICCGFENSKDTHPTLRSPSVSQEHYDTNSVKKSCDSVQSVPLVHANETKAVAIDQSICDIQTTFKDKMNFFEKGVVIGPAKPREFKFFSEDELVRMKMDDERRIQRMEEFAEKGARHFGPCENTPSNSTSTRRVNSRPSSTVFDKNSPSAIKCVRLSNLSSFQNILTKQEAKSNTGRKIN